MWNTSATSITLWATFGKRLQNSAIKQWTPAPAATVVELADAQFKSKPKFDWRPQMDPSNYCRKAPIDTGNTYYDERSK